MCVLLRGDEGNQFLNKYKTMFNLIFMDVPFGYFGNLEYDRPFARNQVATILRGAKTLLVDDGTILIRIGEEGKDMWREVANEVGLLCERSTIVLVHEAAWSRRKAWFSHGKQTNHHYMLVFHHTPRATTRDSPPWYVSKTRWGALSAHGNMCEPTV